MSSAPVRPSASLNLPWVNISDSLLSARMVKPMPTFIYKRVCFWRVCFWRVCFWRVSTIALTSLMLSLPVIASAQSNSNSVDAQPDANLSASTAPLTLTLQDAIARARKNNPEYRAALAQYGSAKEDRVQGRAALLPGVNYNAGFLYTQGNGTATGRFVGANGVHEYISQGNVHQDISLQGIADYRRARAAEAVARARSEIAARGLVVTVVQDY